MSVPHHEVQRGIIAASAVQQGSRIAWGGVWSGLLVALGVVLVLTVLGLAIGISATEMSPGEEANTRGLGIGAAVWSGLTLVIALFLGGLVSTSTGMVYDRASGLIQGVLVWVLAVLLLIYMAASGVSMLAGGVFGALGGATRSAASAASAGMDATELTAGDVDQITSRLRDPTTVQVVAAATGMTRAEAQSTLSAIAERVESVRDNPVQAAAEARKGAEDIAAKVAERAKQAAATAQPYASASMWSTLLALLLALGAAIGGAMMGRSRVANQLNEVARSAAAEP